MKTLTEPTPTLKTGEKPHKRKEVICIRLDPAIHARAKQLAEAEKRNFSQYVELALEQYMRQQQALAQYVKPGASYPVFTPHGQEAAAAKLTELLKGRS